MTQLPGMSVDEQVFVIGDVHGQAVALEKALARIAETPGTGMPRHLIFIGDIIDRGPESVRATDLVLKSRELAAVDKMTFLPGNHEIMMLNAIRNPRSMTATIWIDPRNGGLEVVKEIDENWRNNPLGIDGLVKERLGDFIALIDKSPNHLWMGDLLFVHAGVMPGRDIDEFLKLPRILVDYDSFDEMHWSWIRDPFLIHEGGWDKDRKTVIVHGHTPQNMGFKLNPEYVHGYLDCVGSNRRICVDAGAARGFDQVALLMISGLDYTLEVIQEEPFDPDHDECDAPGKWILDAFKYRHEKELEMLRSFSFF